MSELTTRRTPERRVLGDLGNTKAEPVSPTANLRLLTSLASSLKSAADGVCQTGKIGSRATTVENGERLLPRKQKSLGLLCNKFLDLYPLTQPEDIEPPVISLDGTAKALGTEKRRIYDIINVLESLEMAKKAGKNRYLWHGRNGLVTTLAKFKLLAVKSGLDEQIQEIQRTKKAYTGDYGEDSPGASAIYRDDMEDEPYSDTGIKEEKSLGAMCQKFVMLFLVSLKNGVINLDIAAKVLITDADSRSSVGAEGSAGSRFKTKVRRLYDIANVLTAIGLIKKVYMYDRTIRKPVFKYIGPDVQYADSDRETPVRERCSTILTSMTTPSKSCGIAGRRASSTGSAATRRFPDDAAGTPVTHKRRPLKRKLLVGDSAFARTYSSPCLESGASRSIERLDDSILRVAEMELEKLNSSEESTTPKVCAKLFPRYNSDSCIPTNNHVAPLLENCGNRFVNVVADSSGPSATKLPFVVVSKENNAGRAYESSPKTDRQQTTTPLRTPLQISMLDASTPVRTIFRADGAARLAPTASLSVPTFKTIVPRKLIPTASSSASAVEGGKFARAPLQRRIEPTAAAAARTTPKVVSLARFDPKKLIPIRRSDLKIPLTPVRSFVLDGATTSPGFAILTRIPAPPIVSPGDTFKAVKVGNTLQLVPIKNDDCAIRPSPVNDGDNGNGS